MITINLKPGARRQVQRGNAMAGVRERFKSIGARVKDPALALAVGTWIAVIVVVGAFYLVSRSQVNALEPRLQQTQAEYRRYHTFEVEKRLEEKVRDSITNQIGTISSVDAQRYIWPHVLDEVAGALPVDTWLTAVAEPVVQGSQPGVTDSNVTAPVTVLVSGITNDLENYTTFLRRLGESHWLVDVLPVNTATAIQDNRALTTFTVQMTFSRADSSQLRTVPILESTVR